jgi:UDP-N-acetylmuramoyl-L-alanyl-D-glutamate--2,6-diaminopimelate ligase
MVRWFVDRSPTRGIPSVGLRRLIPEATFVGGTDWVITGCSADTRTIEPGQVYVAIRGAKHDGHDFVATAIERGASGVVVEHRSAEAGRLQAVVPDTRAAYSRLCHALAGDPADRLDLIGIGGGPGASIVATFLESILDRAGRRYGRVGPEGWSDGLATLPTGPGFPEAPALAAMLVAMTARGCVGGIVEITQDALEETAVAEGMGFAAAVATCVRGASDEDAEVVRERRGAYARLVRRVRPGGVVVVDEDEPDSEILGAVNLDADRVSIGIDRAANLQGVVESADVRGSRFRLVGGGLDAAVTLRLGGIESVRHALAAAAVAARRGVSLGEIVAGLEAVAGLPGRFESVEEGQAFEVRVDPARSPEELATALDLLRFGRTGRLICVVGAGGHGERPARKQLAAAAEAGADLVVLTSDNPRSEDPRHILDELLSGMKRPGRARVEPDRRLAIELALASARPGDAVLIAGKGRHAFQILADRVIPFDDRAVAAAWLRAKRDAAGSRRNSA